MHKILLIEDRSERQNNFMSDTGIELDRYSDVLDNAIGEKYDEIFYDLKNDLSYFENYSVIISHKSAFGEHNSSMIEKLKNYCQASKKPLVFFSGGIDESYYHKSTYELISINSKTLYSQNIKLFLEEFRAENEDILMLLYGKRWKLNIALTTLEKLTYFLQKNSDDDVDYEEFIGKIDVHLLDKIGYGSKLIKNEFDEISKVEIEKLKKELRGYVEMSVIYE